MSGEDESWKQSALYISLILVICYPIVYPGVLSRCPLAVRSEGTANPIKARWLDDQCGVPSHVTEIADPNKPERSGC